MIGHSRAGSIIFLFLQAPWLAAGAADHPVSGLVTFEGKPLGGVPIGVNLFERGFRRAETDGDGRFRLDLPRGEALFHVGPDWERGLAQAPNRIVEVRGAAERIDFDLCRGFPVRGRTLDASGEPRPMGGNVSCPERREDFGLGSGPDGEFATILPPGRYFFSFHRGEDGEEALERVEVIDREIAGLAIRTQGRASICPDPPLPLDLLEISAPGPEGMAEVRGLPGASPGGHTVAIHQLSSCELFLADAARDGSFRASVFAPWGSFLQIGSRPALQRGIETRELPPHPGIGAAWVISRYPKDASGGAGTTSLHGTVRAGSRRVFFRGALEGDVLFPGEALRLRGKLVLPDLKGAIGPDCAAAQVRFFFHRLFDRSGRQLSPVRILASSYLTPTGIPIEGVEDSAIGGSMEDLNPERAVRTASGCEWTVESEPRLPAGAPAGWYALAWRASIEGDRARAGPVQFFQEVQEFRGETLAIVPAGEPEPPRLIWTLFSGLASCGSRALLPRETEGSCGLAPAAVFRPREFVVPLKDARTGEPVAYRFEPGVPFTSCANRPFISSVPTPTIPFSLPGGELKVSIQGPEGFSRQMGPSAFRGGRNNLHGSHPAQANPALRFRGFERAFGNNYLGEIYELTTSDPSFEARLPVPGRYEVLVEGWVKDIFGNLYRGGGHYSFLAGEPLALEPGEFPGTPHEVGDVLTPSVHILPPAAAEIEGELLFLPRSDPERAVRWPFHGRSNRFGLFAAREGFHFKEPGEYRLDLTARSEAPDGMLRAGSLRSASVCADPATPISARGERGLRSPGSTNRPAWFIEGLSPGIARIPGEGFHAPFPYFPSDVLWLRDHESIFPTVTFVDRDGRYADLIERHHPEIHRGVYSGLFNRSLLPIDMRAIGEVPAVGSGPWPAGQAPASRELHAYSYSTTVRPGVQVRSIVQEITPVAYWSLDDPYNLQAGAGPKGDLPGDFKAFFGGIVIRHPPSGTTGYGIYGSMAVIVPPDDPLGNRVAPPFRGRPGGPDGGPLLTIRGREHDLFLTLTGARPGAVLEVGDLIELSGLAWPLVQVEVELAVDGPDGKSESIRLRSNKVGAFADPASSLVARLPGRYSARVRATAKGRTSAGQLEEPFPGGDLPGTPDGRFSFFVVPALSRPLEVKADGISFTRGARAEFTAALPDGEGECEAWVTLTLPGIVLEDRPLEVAGGRFSFLLDAASLREEFPSIDREPVDTFDMTFYARARPAAGRGALEAEVSHFAQKVLIQGARIFIGDREARP